VSVLLSEGVAVCSVQELLVVVKQVLEICAFGEREIQKLSADVYRGHSENVDCVADLLGKIFKKSYSLLKVKN